MARRAPDRRTVPALERRPVFEEQARVWVRRFADPATLGGFLDHTSPSSAVIDGTERRLDVVVAAGGEGVAASEGEVQPVGEAKAGETVGTGHLRRLEKARAYLGACAAHARLLLLAPAFHPELVAAAEACGDVELVDLDRLYEGS